MINLNYNNILLVISDTQNIMNDIFLSGFHSIQISTLERLKGIETAYYKLDMKTGGKLISHLYDELNKRVNSFKYDINNITEIFCRLDFYIENIKEYLRP